MAEARELRRSNEILLDMRGISKSYPGVQALEEADFSVRQGEIHGLVGKNGAGKSTLMGVLMGIRDADSGSVAMDGRERGGRQPADHARRRHFLRAAAYQLAGIP